MYEGPHMVKAWVSAPNVPSGSPPPVATAQVSFFVRPSSPAPEDDTNRAAGDAAGKAEHEEEEEELSRWASSLMTLLVQHPPPAFVFRSRATLFVEVRVIDKEMQLNLEQAVDLMYSRATVRAPPSPLHLSISYLRAFAARDEKYLLYLLSPYICRKHRRRCPCDIAHTRHATSQHF
jgi:hypothetical protein